MTPRVLANRRIYAGHVELTMADIRVGEQTIQREIVGQTEAVAVLPYDPSRKVVMLVQVLRAPILVTTGQDFLLEAPAGLIDPGEDPSAAAKRELSEETGLVLGDIQRVARLWSTPGVSTERITLFLAEYSLADRRGEGGGLADERGQLRAVERPLLSILDEGAIEDMKTFALLLQLRLNQPDLFT